MAPVVAQRLAQRSISARSARRLGTGWPRLVDVDITQAEPHSAGREASASSRCIAAISGVVAARSMRVVAHHEHAQRAVADERRQVDAEAARRTGLDPLGEGLPAPVDTYVEQDLRELLDLAEHA